MIARTLLAATAVFIGLAVSSPAMAQETVVVASRVIYPGETVSTDLLEEVRLRKGARAAPSVALDFAEVEGKVARRTILPRRYIPLASLRDAWLVERGKPARVVFLQGALAITISAVPLESGSAGDVVRVRNVDSGTVFSGTVLADGTIRVGAT